MLTADDLLRQAARRWPDAPALWRDGTATSYASLDAAVDGAAAWLRQVCPLRGSRVAVWLDKRVDTVVALFAAMRAGHVAVPVNPALRAAQVLDCLEDCRAALLLSDTLRLQALAAERRSDVLHYATVAGAAVAVDAVPWRASDSTAAAASAPLGRDTEELAILFYTSGSTGAPKGVMVTHANLLAGAGAVNAYLGNGPEDRLLAALPPSFDAGFSQLTTAFASGASVVLLDHLFPADVLTALDTYRVTGVTAVPPLYLQLLAALERTRGRGEGSSEALSASGTIIKSSGASLRYFANTGGHLPLEAWLGLRRHWPQAQPIAMYGLTEAFRASWLPPAQFEARPGSMGSAVPGGTRLHVLRPDGTPCAADEPGELVQQGPLVARGYWNDPARSALRFRPGPDGAPAVWSGDTVRADADGYLWFIGRDDEQIKTSGYRVSPSEVEAAAAAAGWPECVAMGVPDRLLGQVIVLVVGKDDGDRAEQAGAAADSEPLVGRPQATDVSNGDRNPALTKALRAALPAWMVPRRVAYWAGGLPRNANGKFDRARIRESVLRDVAPSEAAALADKASG